MFGWGMPAVLLFAATTMFLESIGRPLPGMVFMLVSNVVNVALNWLFIYGHLGVPEMGAEGAALATTIARWAGTGGIFVWVYATLGASRLGARPGRLTLGRNRRRRAHRAGRRLLAVGIPIGLAHGFEAGAFASLTIFAGWLGGVEVAAYGIVLNLFALPFMPALGLSTAANVRVGPRVRASATGREPGKRRGPRSASSSFCSWSIGLGYAHLRGIPRGALHGRGGGARGRDPGRPGRGARAPPGRAPGGARRVPPRAFRRVAGYRPPDGRVLGHDGPVRVVARACISSLAHPGLVASVGIGCIAAVALLVLRFRRVVARAM